MSLVTTGSLAQLRTGPGLVREHVFNTQTPPKAREHVFNRYSLRHLKSRQRWL